MAERTARLEKYYREKKNKRIMRKAGEINKILSGKNVADVIFNYAEDMHIVTFKNGQVFKFRTYFPCVTHERKIVPILED